MIDIIRYGESALLINFDQSIDIPTNQKVIHLYNKLDQLKGVEFLIPAYCSLLVGYNINAINEQTLIEFINTHTDTDTSYTSNRLLKIPVCYDDQFGLDLLEICNQRNLTKEEFIEIHTGTTYNVYMMGFIPGFAYMGKTHEAIHCTRKKEPRKNIESRSVAIAGAQTGIYPCDAPGGWQIVGKTPIEVIYKSKNPFLFQLSDRVEFYTIGIEEYLDTEKACKQGAFEVEITNE